MLRKYWDIILIGVLEVSSYFYFKPNELVTFFFIWGAISVFFLTKRSAYLDIHGGFTTTNSSQDYARTANQMDPNILNAVSEEIKEESRRDRVKFKNPMLFYFLINAILFIITVLIYFIS